MPSVYALNCELTNVELLTVMPLADPLIIVTFVLVSPLSVPPLIVTVFKVVLLNVEAFDVMAFILPLVILTFVNVAAFDAIVPLEIVTFVKVNALAVPPVIVTLPNDETYVITSLMFVPSLNTIVLLPAGKVNAVPVGDAFVPLEMMTELDRPFVTRYCFSIAGTNNVCTLAIVPTKFSRRLRAVCAEFVSVSAIAAFELAKVTLAEPVIASSMAVPRLVFVVLPHVPA